jgi:hypothetical protein
VKRPPSQRPERQPGPLHHLEVGKPYHPARRVWPEGSDYNYRDGGHELRLFLARLSNGEVGAVRKGRVEFGLLVELPELFVVTRFYAPGSDRVLLSFDCSYQWHRVPAASRTEPPAWEETNPQLRALCTVILVEATGGLIMALRSVSYSPEFTRAFHKAIADQAALPYDAAAHDRAVADVVRRYNTDQLWVRCQHRCEGGQ